MLTTKLPSAMLLHSLSVCPSFCLLIKLSVHQLVVLVICLKNKHTQLGAAEMFGYGDYVLDQIILALNKIAIQYLQLCFGAIYIQRL